MKAVCIGGPADGKYCEIQDGRYRFFVTVRNSLPICYEYKEANAKDIDPINRACSEHWYTLKSLYILGQTVYFFDYDNRINEYIDCSAFLKKIIALFGGK
jgi:hypothetical protein